MRWILGNEKRTSRGGGGGKRRRRAAPLRLLLNAYNHPEGENGQGAAGVSILDAATPPHRKFFHSSDLTASDGERKKKSIFHCNFAHREVGSKGGK